MRRTVGTVQEVLAETRTADGHTLGYTRGYLPCRIDDDITPGETVAVTVYRTENDMLFATLKGDDTL